MLNRIWSTVVIENMRVRFDHSRFLIHLPADRHAGNVDRHGWRLSDLARLTISDTRSIERVIKNRVRPGSWAQCNNNQKRVILCNKSDSISYLLHHKNFRGLYEVPHQTFPTKDCLLELFLFRKCIFVKIEFRKVWIRWTRRENAFARMHQGKSSRPLSEVTKGSFHK